MPSPANLFRGLYTVAEIQAKLRALAETGLPGSVSGAGKSMTFLRMTPEQYGIELRAELNRLQGNSEPRRVEQILIP